MGEKLWYELSDVSGRVIKTAVLVSPNETIDFSDKTAGLYILSIKDNHRTLGVHYVLKQ
jgi:hypothetical protein